MDEFQNAGVMPAESAAAAANKRFGVAGSGSNNRNRYSIATVAAPDTALKILTRKAKLPHGMRIVNSFPVSENSG